MELLKQITPKHSRDIVGNKLAIRTFIDILKQPGYTPKVILLLGPTGCGKTTLCNLVFSELNFKVYEINSKDNLNNLSTFIVHKTIDSYEETPRRKIIFIDNIDILINTERSTLSIVDNSIVHLIRTNTYMVLTSKFSEEKTIINALKKNVEIIKLTYPPIKDAFIYLSTILEDRDEEELLTIVKKQRGNIRDVILNIDNTQTELDQIVQDRGFNEYNNFEIMHTFFTNSKWNDVIAILNSDPSMMSYLLYENVMDEIYHNREAVAVMKSFLQINTYFIWASILEKFVQDNLEWSLYNPMQIIKIAGIFVVLKNLKTKKERKDVKFRFSQVLSKLSHKNMMYKKLQTITLPTVDLLNLIDAKQIQSSEDLKQVSSTYHKYFG